jgi:P27 family predicted phage terminase small subunit
MAGRYKESNVQALPNAFDDKAHHERHFAIATENLPDDLGKLEQKVWLRLVPELSKQGRFKKHFADFICQYCIVKVRMDGWRVYLDENDWSYVTSGRHGQQHKSRPEVAQLNDDWRKWNSLVAQLGLSPATELRFNDKQGSLFPDDDDFGDV